MMIQISLLRRDGGTQPRGLIDALVVGDYATAIKNGAIFPDAVAFYDGTNYWLADGFHRTEAYLQAGFQEMPVSVHSGTLRDAKLFSFGANEDHGLRRKVEDKRRAVEAMLRDPEWVTWSDHEIARQCKVSQPFVGKVRALASPRVEQSVPTNNVISREFDTTPIAESFDIKQDAQVEKPEPTERAYTRKGKVQSMKVGEIGRKRGRPPKNQEQPEPVRVRQMREIKTLWVSLNAAEKQEFKLWIASEAAPSEQAS